MDGVHYTCGVATLPKPGNELDEHGKEADAFVRARVPELAHSTLIEFSTQVVAGTNYSFTYGGYEGEVRVFSQPWTHTLKITLPNGTVISNK